MNVVSQKVGLNEILHLSFFFFMSLIIAITTEMKGGDNTGGNTSDIISIRSVHHLSWYYVMPKRDKERGAHSCATLARGSLNNSCSPAETQVIFPDFDLRRCFSVDVFLRLRARHHLRRQGLVMCLIHAEKLPRLDAVLHLYTYVCVHVCVCTNSGQSVPCENLWPCTQLDGPALCIEQQLGSCVGSFFLPDFGLLGAPFAKCVDTRGGITPDRQMWNFASCL